MVKKPAPGKAKVSSKRVAFDVSYERFIGTFNRATSRLHDFRMRDMHLLKLPGSDPALYELKQGQPITNLNRRNSEEYPSWSIATEEGWELIVFVNISRQFEHANEPRVLKGNGRYGMAFRREPSRIFLTIAGPESLYGARGMSTRLLDHFQAKLEGSFGHWDNLHRLEVIRKRLGPDPRI